MKANELRIGNMVQLYRRPSDKDKSVYSVKDILKHKNIYFVSLSDDFMVNIETGIGPIPITKEWLIKFGFSKSYPDGEESFGYWDLNNVEFLDFENGEFEINSTAFIFKYVHQLQNLYFVLTGEELKLKEDKNEYRTNSILHILHSRIDCVGDSKRNKNLPRQE